MAASSGDDPGSTGDQGAQGAGLGREVEGIKIGEPRTDYDIYDSIAYSFQWFLRKEVDGVPHAACLLCQFEKEEARAAGKPISSSRRKKIDCLKIPQGSTKPLFTHMEAHHEEENIQFMKQHKAVEDSRAEKRKRKRSGDGTKQLKLFNNNSMVGVDNRHDPKLQSRWDDAVVKFVAETGISFYACQKLGILLEAIWTSGNFRLRVKSDVTVSRHVTERSLSLKVEVFSILKCAALEDGGLPGIAFTSDLWRSRALDSYMALTCHFITADMELIKLVPFVQYFGDNRHTGCNLKLMMDQFIKTIGMDNPQIIKTCVTDNASNNKVMFRLSNNLQEYYCNIHTMQLAVNDVFDLKIINIKVSDAMEKCHDIATFVRRSEHRKNELKAACSESGINPSIPKIPNKTRWNSKEASVATTIKLKTPLQQVTQADTTLEWDELVPNAAEWKLLESLVEILARIKVANKNWEGDLKPTIQNVIPELYNIKDTLDKKKRNREVYISVLARELQKLIDQRFPNCGTTDEQNCIAHLLDPEYQGVVLKQYGVYETTRQKIIQMGSKYESATAPVVEVTREESNAAEDDNLSAAQRLKRMNSPAVVAEAPGINNKSATELELEKFEQMNIQSYDNPLDFYRDHSKLFPILCKIVREIYSIPASSACSERVFSVGGLICTAKRSRLLPEKLSDLMLLKLNSQAVLKYKEKHKVEKKFTPAETRDCIRVDLEAMANPEDDSEEEYVEDLEDIEGEAEDVPNDVTMVEVEDNIG